MTQQDIESIVSGIRQLGGVIVVTVPDCLLYSNWQKSDSNWDAEVAGAYFGQLLTSGTDGLRSVEGWQHLHQMILEVSEGLMVLRRTDGADFVVGYIFDKGTALGWIRLQVDRTFPMIEQRLRTDVAQMGAAEVAGIPAPAAIESYDDGPEITMIAEEPAPAPAPAQAPAQTPPPPPAAAPAPAPADDGMTKGARLMKYLEDHAPDTHAALLRVSLQTGLPLTRLRSPDSLSDAEYSKVAESVRLIVGVKDGFPG